jgi:hypothetical protein
LRLQGADFDRRRKYRLLFCLATEALERRDNERSEESSLRHVWIHDCISLSVGAAAASRDERLAASVRDAARR